MIPVSTKRLIIWIMLLTCHTVIVSRSAYSQSSHYRIEQVPFSKELPSFFGTCILQDSDGFMWFGSRDGLYRYDGTHFKRFVYVPLSDEGLNQEIVRNLIEDDEGNFWFTSLFRFTRFDRRTKWIVDWANLYNIPMFVHNFCSPVGTMAAGHAFAAIQSCISLESDSVELPYWQNLIVNDGSFYKEGYLEIPDKPGLGIELNEDVVREHLVEGSGYFE